MSKRPTQPKARVRRRIRSVVGLPDFEKTMKAIDRFAKRSRKVCLMVGLNGLRYMQALERKANARIDRPEGAKETP